MITQKKFKVTLLSDVIVSEKAATEGNMNSLDFIPGSTFLGVTAKKLYNKITKTEAYTLFHSGQVRFSDAHLLVNGSRMVRTPLSWYKHKEHNLEGEVYLHHEIENIFNNNQGHPVQLKQCREGFVSKMKNNIWLYKKVDKRFAIKSAYDRKNRKSADEQMFGYESIPAGLEYCFYVDFDNNVSDTLRSKVLESLSGLNFIGKSRTAEYALAEFAIDDDIQVNVEQYNDINSSLLIYAESRLIFYNEYGVPNFLPTVEQLGLSKGSICWEKSQIQTFQYAPYNGKRKTRDYDRCGIEKGSVFYIQGATMKDVDSELHNRGVGSFLHEGFGRVIVNPVFLKSKTNENARHIADLVVINNYENENIYDCNTAEVPVYEVDNLVVSYLTNKVSTSSRDGDIHRLTNSFINENIQYFSNNNKWASQWGVIRQKAIQSVNKGDIINSLFEENRGFLVHGVSKEQWEGVRLESLRAFIENIDENIVRDVVVNLAAEMAKKTKKEVKS